MFAIIAMMLVSAIVMVVVQAEMYALLNAVAYARNQNDASLSQKLRLGSARYEWASVIWHETSVEEPVYSLSRPLALFIVTEFATVALMDYGLGAVDGPLALLMALMVSLSYFVKAYGASFAAHRELVAECQKQGTWQLA